MTNTVYNIEKLTQFMQEQSGSLGITCDKGEWYGMLNFGQEASDSPMAAGSIATMSTSFHELIKEFIKELNI